MKLKILPTKSNVSIYLELANKLNLEKGHWLVFECDTLTLVMR